MQMQAFQSILIPFLGTTLGSACVLLASIQSLLISAMESQSMLDDFSGILEWKYSNLGTVLFAAGFMAIMVLVWHWDRRNYGKER